MKEKISSSDKGDATPSESRKSQIQFKAKSSVRKDPPKPQQTIEVKAPPQGPWILLFMRDFDNLQISYFFLIF